MGMRKAHKSKRAVDVPLIKARGSYTGGCALPGPRMYVQSSTCFISKTNNNYISRARKKRLTRSQELTSRQKRAPVLVYLSPMPRPFLCSNFIFRQCTSSPSNAFYLVKRCGVSASAVAGVSCTCRIR